MATMSNIEYKQDTFKDTYDELVPIFLDHWKEVGLKNMDFNMDTDLLLKIEETGQLFCVSAKQENKIVGYVCLYISPHPLSATTFFATTLAFYVDPKQRRTRIGYNLVKTTEMLLKGRVKWVDLLLGHKSKFKKWIKFLGYKEEDVIYRKIL